MSTPGILNSSTTEVIKTFFYFQTNCEQFIQDSNYFNNYEPMSRHTKIQLLTIKVKSLSSSYKNNAKLFMFFEKILMTL